jgi:uncharacterized protein (UPF0261 family)
MSTQDNPSELKIPKVARIEDKANSTFLEVIEFPVSDTARRRLELAPSVINNLGSFENALRDAGANLPKD